jgi:two-component system CheB/CheR fusion protein
MRIVPYRTSEDRIDGLVMTFIDIDDMKRGQHLRTYAENIVETVRESLLVLDGNFRVQSANQSFFKKFQVKEKQTIGQLIYDLGNGQWNIPASAMPLARSGLECPPPRSKVSKSNRSSVKNRRRNLRTI